MQQLEGLLRLLLESVFRLMRFREKTPFDAALPAHRNVFVRMRGPIETKRFLLGQESLKID
jgi:hypothetical protein